MIRPTATPARGAKDSRQLVHTQLATRLSVFSARARGFYLRQACHQRTVLARGNRQDSRLGDQPVRLATVANARDNSMT